MNKEKFLNYLQNEIKNGNIYIEKLKDSKDLYDMRFVENIKFQQQYLFHLIDFVDIGFFD